MAINDRKTEIPPQARLATDSGNLIEAIRITREQTGLGLREAKEAVEAYGRGVHSRTTADPDTVEMPLKAVASLRRGKLIEAIKHTRDATGLGLKDSRLAVEAYLATNPAVDLKFQAARAEQRKAWLWRAVLVVLIGAAVVGYVLR